MYRDMFNNDSETCTSILLRFEDNDGMPRINSMSYLIGNKSTIIIVTNKTIKIKISDIEEYNFSNPKEIIYKWKQEISNQKGFIVLKKDEGRMPLYNSPIFISIAANAIMEENENKFPLNAMSLISGISEIKSIAPIRDKPRRAYHGYKFQSTPEGEHVPYNLRRLFDKDKLSDTNIIDNINVFGNNSAMFKEIGVKNYGRGKYTPFEINIKFGETPIKISNVGYGVSQVLPVIVDVLYSNKNSWLSIQQPEVHLHPKAQAALGTFFYEAYIYQKKKFLIETHSDFIINRFRIHVKRNDNEVDSQVLFFERKDGRNIVHSLIIDENGDYPMDQPESFREFFIQEEFDILGL